MSKRGEQPDLLCADGCGRIVEQIEGSGGRRKYSIVCRPPRDRSPAPETGPVPSPAPGTVSMADATRTELARLDAGGSVEAMLLVQLAERMDNTRDGSPYASLARQYREGLDQIRAAALRAGAGQAGGDQVNEMERRRAAKQRAAGAGQ